jgi:hypothetical protein
MNPAAVSDFYNLVLKITGQGDSWSLLELFKAKFGAGYSRSSSESWAISDLHSGMHGAANNAPAFIDAFWSGCEEIKASLPHVGVPDEHVVNAILLEHCEPYEVRPPKLVARGNFPSPVVAVPELSLGERARNLIEQSLTQADRFLIEGKPRQAVQEILWLLETVSTAFEGRENALGAVEGKYFNTIVRDLRKLHHGKVLSEAMGWVSKLHGFLSSPSGGGVRHGLNLASGVEPASHEAKLYCDLTRSYIAYLLAELGELPSVG